MLPVSGDGLGGCCQWEVSRAAGKSLCPLLFLPVRKLNGGREEAAFEAWLVGGGGEEGSVSTSFCYTESASITIAFWIRKRTSGRLHGWYGVCPKVEGCPDVWAERAQRAMGSWNNLGIAIWLCSGEGGSGSVGMEKRKVAIKTREQGAGEKASA